MCCGLCLGSGFLVIACIAVPLTFSLQPFRHQFAKIKNDKNKEKHTKNTTKGNNKSFYTHMNILCVSFPLFFCRFCQKINLRSVFLQKPWKRRQNKHRTHTQQPKNTYYTHIYIFLVCLCSFFVHFLFKIVTQS